MDRRAEQRPRSVSNRLVDTIGASRESALRHPLVALMTPSCPVPPWCRWRWTGNHWWRCRRRRHGGPRRGRLGVRRHCRNRRLGFRGRSGFRSGGCCCGGLGQSLGDLTVRTTQQIRRLPIQSGRILRPRPFRAGGVVQLCRRVAERRVCIDGGLAMSQHVVSCGRRVLPRAFDDFREDPLQVLVLRLDFLSPTVTAAIARLRVAPQQLAALLDG